MLVTLRDVPADAEIASHQLLLRGGYIRRVASGVYAYMPLMWKVLKKITSIVEQEMDKAGSLQTLLPQLHPAEMWKKSGRWQSYTQGEGIMFHLKDRQGRDLGLGPTHEEVITTLAGELIHSYKQLPITLYQIQTKFRDEIRPRFGLMRSREFIMKDAYSFHTNEEDLKRTYKNMNATYNQIFKSCGLKAFAVDADSGAIGGAASQEFMVSASSGEDLILSSSDGKYSANQEKAVSKASEPVLLKNKKPTTIDTPNQKSISELCSAQGLKPSQIIKVLLLIAILENGQEQPLIISLRGDQDLNEVKLTNALTQKLGTGVLKLSQISPENLNSQGLAAWPFGSIGPDFQDSMLKGSKSWAKSFLRFADQTAAELNCFFCGANLLGKHKAFANWALLGGVPTTLDLRKAKSGDRCIHDQNETLEEKRGIEVGHIFQLGRKYSEALKARFTNENGAEESFWMGCYGIGISRLAQAAVEQNHDEAGICWPISIAPYQVIIVIANMQDPRQVELGEEVYKNLKSVGIDALLDDRAERAGVKFKDADLIGVPWRIVVGRDASNGKFELVNRASKETQVMSTEEVLKKISSEIFENRC